MMKVLSDNVEKGHREFAPGGPAMRSHKQEVLGDDVKKGHRDFALGHQVVKHGMMDVLIDDVVKRVIVSSRLVSRLSSTQASHQCPAFPQGV